MTIPSRARAMLVLVGLALAGGCAQPTAAVPTPQAAAVGAGFSAGDLAFSQQMIPHHRQTIQLAELAGRRSRDGYVREVADRLISEEKADIETMSAWLRGWGSAVPAGHAAHTGPDMISPARLDAVAKSRDGDFDRMWLALMADHLRNGVRMAETAKTGGRHGPTAELAEKLATEQPELISEITARARQA